MAGVKCGSRAASPRTRRCVCRYVAPPAAHADPSRGVPRKLRTARCSARQNEGYVALGSERHSLTLQRVARVKWWRVRIGPGLKVSPLSTNKPKGLGARLRTPHPPRGPTACNYGWGGAKKSNIPMRSPIAGLFSGKYGAIRGREIGFGKLSRLRAESGCSFQFRSMNLRIDA
jgi:hypothetical protein